MGFPSGMQYPRICRSSTRFSGKVPREPSSKSQRSGLSWIHTRGAFSPVANRLPVAKINEGSEYPTAPSSGPSGDAGERPEDDSKAEMIALVIHTPSWPGKAWVQNAQLAAATVPDAAQTAA